MTFLAATLGHGTQILISLFIILAAAKLMAEIFERFQQPAVVGEILAGVIIGPQVLGWVNPSEITEALAEIGVMFLLFNVGLETKPAAIVRVGKVAVGVAMAGIVVPLLAGWAFMRAHGSTNVEALFVGTALVATSIGITARVLSGLGALDTLVSRIILGAAVIDDILGLLVLAVVTSFAAGGVNYVEISVTALMVIGFTALVTFVGAPVLNRIAPRLKQLRVSHAFFLTALILCLGLSAAAAVIGIAAIIGAFLAGLALAEAAEDNHALHKQVSGVTEFLVPFFLVSIGMRLRLDIFRDSSALYLSGVIILIAVLTKFLGCGLAARSLGWRAASQIGVGMTPRGEVGIVVAQIGLAVGVLSDSVFSVVLIMAVATTLIAPPLLKLLFKGEKPAAQS